MKNYIKLVTIIGFALLIFACSNDNKTTDSTQANQAPEIDNEAVEKYDFRKAKWGMSRQEVKESEETEPILENENTIDYSTILLGMQAQVGYTFKDDELIRAGFFFFSKLKTKNDYIEKYHSLKEELTKVNGKPVLDTEKQKDPSQTIDSDNKGEAVCNGDMLYATQWDLPATDIQLVLRGEDSECMITILYLSEEGLRQLLENRTQQQ
ncbi:MAG: hypothetical protein WBC96_07180 [Thermodesulfobacteriota bacterium]